MGILTGFNVRYLELESQVDLEDALFLTIIIQLSDTPLDINSISE